MAYGRFAKPKSATRDLPDNHLSTIVMYPAVMRRDDLPGLTGLRGYAALAVVLFHYSVPGFSWGWLSVDVFFVLSGFVLSHVYRDGLDRADFLWARTARTIPTHLVATALVGAAAVALCGNGMAEFVRSLALTAVINPPTWSLTVEWGAYLVFAGPAPTMLFHRTPARVLLLIGYTMAIIGLFDGGATRFGEPALTWPHFMRGIGWFAVGIALYRLGVRPPRCWLYDNRLALWLGDISYPMYLIQFLPIFLWGIEPTWLGIAVTLGLAVVLHHAVEAPARRWLRGMVGSNKAGAGSLPAGLSQP